MTNGASSQTRPRPTTGRDADPARRVALADADVDADVDVDVETQGAGAVEARITQFCREVGLEIGDDDGSCPLLFAPVGPDATHTAVVTGADPRRLVCVDLIGDPATRVTIMTAPGADPGVRDAVAAAIAASGRSVTAIKDSPGFVGPRIVAMVANLGCYMAEIGLAEPGDIDTAMKLGLNYPHGLLEFVDEIGAGAVLDILDGLQDLTGEDRYRPTLWLRRRAVLGPPARTPA